MTGFSVASQLRKNLLVGLTAFGIAGGAFFAKPERADAMFIAFGCAFNSHGCHIPMGLFVPGIIFFFICPPIGLILDQDEDASCSTSTKFSDYDWRKELYAQLPFLKGEREGRAIEVEVSNRWKALSDYLKANPLGEDVEKAKELLLSYGFSSDSTSLSARFDADWVQNLLEQGDYLQSQIDRAKDYLSKF